MQTSIIKKILFLLFILSVVAAAYPALGGGAGSSVQEESTLELNALQLLQEGFREIIRKTTPVVVEVNTVQLSGPSDISPFDLFTVPKEQMERELLKRGLGSALEMQT